MTLKEELERIYGANLGFYDFFEKFKSLCQRLEIIHNNAKNVLYQFYTENFHHSGKINAQNFKANMENAVLTVISNMQSLCYSNDNSDRQSVLTFADITLNAVPPSTYHLYTQYEEEAKNLSSALIALISRQPKATEIYDKLIMRYKQFSLSSEKVRFQDCCDFIQEHKYKIINREAFSGALKMYGSQFEVFLRETIENTPTQNLPNFTQYVINVISHSAKGKNYAEYVDGKKENYGIDQPKSKDEADQPKEQEMEFPEVTKSSLETLLKETFQNYVGMDEVKEKLRQIVAKHKKGLLPQMPIVVTLTGNPGTGKTTASELMTKVLYECGVLQKSKMYKIVASNLQGEYVGQTNPKVQKVFKMAREGGLLIDEIYSLASSRTFTDEAVAELLTQLESKENSGTLIVVAGYADRINDFLQKNPGLKDRFFSRINLKDFTHEDLMEVANKMLSQKGFKFNKKAYALYDELLKKAEKTKDFGNARYVTNSIEEILEIQNERTFDEPDNKVISFEDVSLFKANQAKNKANEKFSSLGFSI